MPNFEKCLEDIRETKKQIELTDSKQRKYQLRRHLNKLLKEYRTAKRYYNSRNAVSERRKV